MVQQPGGSRVGKPSLFAVKHWNREREIKTKKRGRMRTWGGSKGEDKTSVGGTQFIRVQPEHKTTSSLREKKRAYRIRGGMA